MDASVLLHQVDDDDDQSIKLRPIHKAGNRANANILYSDSWLANCRGRRRGQLSCNILSWMWQTTVWRWQAQQHRTDTERTLLAPPPSFPDSQLKVPPANLVKRCELRVCYYVHVHVHIHVRVRVHTSHNPQSSTSSFNNSFKWLCAIRLFAAMPPLNAS